MNAPGVRLAYECDIRRASPPYGNYPEEIDPDFTKDTIHDWLKSQ